MRLAVAGTLTILLAWSCSHDQARNAPAIDTTQRALAEPTPGRGTFDSVALQALTELTDGQSLGSWKAQHRDDSLSNEASYPAGSVCAEMISQTRLADGTRADRYAWFYAPAAPREPLSPLGDRDVAPDAQCRLGAIAVSIEAPASFDTVLGGIERRLRAKYGSGRPLSQQDPGPLFNLAQRWRADSAIVGLGRLWWDEMGDTAHPGSNILVMAALPDSSRSPGSIDVTSMIKWYDAMRARAKIADSTGAAPLTPAQQEVAFAYRMHTASTDCEVNRDSIIDAGERFLVTAHDSSAIAAVHFMLADVFGLKTRAADQGTMGFRRAAIAHYRAALAMEPTRTYPDARNAWFDLWRLIAGRDQSLFHYFSDCGD